MKQDAEEKKSVQRRIARKQIYLFSHQDQQRKELAQNRQTSEAELIRQAVAVLLNDPQKQGANPLPPDETAWQEVLKSFDEVRSLQTSQAPHRWTRDEYYDDPRYQRSWAT